MVYVALLRGINVGGKRKVEMPLLRTVVENAGMSNVSTYINSGNVLFSTARAARNELASTLEGAIERAFGFPVDVVVRDLRAMRDVVQAMPDDWTNDETTKCDVMYLKDEVAKTSVLRRLTIKPDIDDVVYAGGAIIWRVDRTHVTRSGMMKLPGTDLYRQMTIRNCNTTRKILSLLEAMYG